MATFFDGHEHGIPGAPDAAPRGPTTSPGKRTLTAGIFGVRRDAPAAAAPTFGRPGTEETAYFFAATPEDAADGAAPAAGPARGGPATSLLVEDDAEAGPNQMRKAAFLAEAAALMPAEDIEPWRGRPAGELESAMRQRLPGASAVTSARGFLDLLRSQRADAQGGGGSEFASMSESAIRDHVRGGGLGAGVALPSSTRAAMEAAYRQDFSDVRVHTDERSSQLASTLGARAFTVGNQIAFAAGSFAPGSPIGDALLAHELAHVVQQRGGSSSGGSSGASSHEDDADHAATYAMSSIYGGDTASGAPAVPSLRADVGIQRCQSSGGGGGGGGGALTFASSSFTPGTGGPVTANASSSQLELRSAAFSSTGSASVTGGTDADAQGWDIGYLQTVRSTRRTGHYTGTSPNTKFEVSMPANTRDGNPAGNAPWYDSANPSAMHAVSKTATTETASLWDRPGMGFAWDTPDGKSKLASVDGKDQFAAWIVVRKRAAPNTIQFLNWETWEVDWTTTTTYASAGTKTAAASGATAGTGSGAGQGANTPNLTGAVANNVAVAAWS